MHCPACKNPSFETDTECGACGLSLERADGLFGTPPAIPPTVADLAAVLSNSGRSSVQAAARNLHASFPQVRFTVLTAALAPEISLPVYTFWIFNRGGICREIERGASNHDILLVIDPGNSRSNLIIGYGLEPFISTGHLTAALDAAAPAFSKQKFAAGIRSVISSLAATLASVSSEIPAAYGLNPNEIQPKNSSSAAAEF